MSETYRVMFETVRKQLDKEREAHAATRAALAEAVEMLRRHKVIATSYEMWKSRDVDTNILLDSIADVLASPPAQHAAQRAEAMRRVVEAARAIDAADVQDWSICSKLYDELYYALKSLDAGEKGDNTP